MLSFVRRFASAAAQVSKKKEVAGDKRNVLISSILYGTKDRPMDPQKAEIPKEDSDFIERVHYIELMKDAQAYSADIHAKQSRIEAAMNELKVRDPKLYQAALEPYTAGFPVKMRVPTETLSRQGWPYS